MAVGDIRRFSQNHDIDKYVYDNQCELFYVSVHGQRMRRNLKRFIMVKGGIVFVILP